MKLRVPKLESVGNVAENVPRRCRDLFQVELDFSVDSIERLDRIIESISSGDEKAVERMSDALVAMGCYVGEVICRNLGGEWQETGNINGFPIGVKLGKTYLNPIGKVISRFKHGNEHNLSDYVKFSMLMQATFE